MQRQSLGSPASKSHARAGKAESSESAEERRELVEEVDDNKTDKLLRSSPRPENAVIHLIPFVVLACFLILILVSHTPSETEMPRIGAPKRFSAERDSKLERLLDVGKANVLAIGSHRSLQEVEKRVRKPNRWYSPRRLGNFDAA